MFVVYWIGVDPKGGKKAEFAEFESDEMTNALRFMEALRQNTTCSFVSMCSENPNSVGKPGVAEVGPDYNWTKRRHNERKQ